MKLHVIQAEYGDCLILESGTPSNPRRILIDGGPRTTYEKHLKAELQQISGSGGKIDLAVLSHVDNDHIIGLLDLIAELRAQKADGTAETIAVAELWHNTFQQTIGSGNDIETRAKSMMANAQTEGQSMTVTGMAVEGIGQGQRLRLAATAHGIPINSGFAHDLISVREEPETVAIGTISLRIVGPTKENLEELKEEWLDWLETSEEHIASGDPFLAEMADRSVPNLSSIMLLAEEGGKTILFTGDGRGDHLLQGLRQTNVLGPQGNLHVDVLKLPHHGSDRNVTRSFFKAITADKYVISANGKNGNPDLATLIWIVETAKEQERSIEILVTNETPSTVKLVEEYDADEYGYRLTQMEQGSHAMTLDIAS